MTDHPPCDLERILHPLPVEEFLEQYWERRSYHVHRGEPDYFAGLLSMADLDQVIATGKEQPHFTVALIHNGSISHQTGRSGQRFGELPGTVEVDVDSIYSSFADGATVRIYRLERYVQSLWELGGELESRLNTDLHMNVYLTPANSQAFGAHFDSHDVFVLQLEGRKHWTLYEPPVDLPVEKIVRARAGLYRQPLPFDDTFANPAFGREEKREIVLEAGDVLYLPRGFAHQASTRDELSMHLTIGLTALTWHELVAHAVTRRLGEDRLLRTGLPPGFVSDPAVLDDIAALSPELVASATAALSRDHLAASVADLASRFVHSRRPISGGQLDDIRCAETVELESRLRVRPGTTARLEVRGNFAYLLFSGRSLTLPVRTRSMLEHMLRERRFTVGDLETQLGDKSRLVLAKRLLKKGFLSFDREAA